MSTLDYQLAPQGQCSGVLQVPGDKSISHRAVMLAAIAEGATDINGFLFSTDCVATVEAFRAMGVKIEQPEASQVTVQGVGLEGLRDPQIELDMGNSGTAMRLMSGILAGQSFPTTLIGDKSLSLRPMQRIQQPLQEMGANVSLAEAGTAPIKIQPCESLQGIQYQLPVASAQIKSSVLLAGLYAQGKTCVIEGIQSRDHTERMLQAFSCPVIIENNSVCIEGGNTLTATKIDVPGDISSAAFFIVGTLISKSAELVIENVGINPTRNGVIEILQLMGGDIKIINKRAYGVEPAADLVIKSSDLHGIEIPQHLIAKSIDEFPILFIAAACAEGKTELSGAEELRVKESDRIHNMSVGLQSLGISTEEKPDGITIFGGNLQGGEVDSAGDHRVAMSFAISSLLASGSIRIRNVENVATSFPEFVESATRLGLKFK